MTDSSPRRLMRVQYHDDGILLSWPSGLPPLRLAVHLPVDDAIPLAHALQRVTDAGQVDTRTKLFCVQWYKDGVLLSHQLHNGVNWTYLHLPMAGARIVADAILQAANVRDPLVIHDADVGIADDDDFC